MPDLLRARKSIARSMLRGAFSLFDLAAYEVLYRLSPARKHWFFNGGYLPIDEDYLALPEFADEAHCAMMYHQAGRSMISDLEPDPRSILDVGCGQGGGLVYLSKLFPSATLAGTERSLAAVSLARRRVKTFADASILHGRSTHLPFAENSFDLLISVGAPTYFGLTTFVAETSRVLRPGGIASFSGGYRQGDHAAIKAELATAAEEHGLDMHRYRDITPHTFASLKADIPRRQTELAKVPWPFSLYATRWADMPGSVEYQEYEEGLRADFSAVLVKAVD